MTHEYVIATGGVIFVADEDESGRAPSAIAWAADRVLAVGSDDVVRAISRGDSTFIDLGGCVVTPLPADPAPAERQVGEATAAEGSVDVIAALARADVFDPASRLEPGAAADLAFWKKEPARSPRIVAIVRSGAFTEGDEHRGPFPSPRTG